MGVGSLRSCPTSPDRTERKEKEEGEEEEENEKKEEGVKEEEGVAQGAGGGAAHDPQPTSDAALPSRWGDPGDPWRDLDQLVMPGDMDGLLEGAGGDLGDMRDLGD